MVDLPPEIFTDIFTRLPVKSFLRFRCVSKACCSLVDSSNFIELQLRKSIQTNLNCMVILWSGTDIFAVNLDNLEQAAELNHPLMCYGHRINVLGFCDGLVCLKNVADDTALWNPSLRKHRLLPPFPDDKNRGSGSAMFGFDVFGFGCDVSNGDYKVVRISLFIDLNDLSYGSDVNVFSLKSDTWKRVESMPCAVRQPIKTGVLACGALHWVVIKKLEADGPESVIAFDIKTEKFREVPLPDFGDEKFRMSVTVLGGRLCLFGKYKNIGIDVWLMNEYGVKESWCKVFTIAQPETIRYFKCVWPLAISRDGDKVLLEVDNRKLCWYNLTHNTVSNVQVSGIPASFESGLCMGSLVPPTFIRSHGHEEISDLDENNGKKREEFLSQGFKLVL